MPMNDNAQLYHNINRITRTHASLYLEEFAPRFRWKENGSKIIDVGSGDGSVTNILRTYLPKNYEILIGADISDNMVKFANENYSDKKLKFIKLDIEDDIPAELKENFDHVFSLYLFHWIQKQEKAFTNIYYLLKNEGECFMTFLGYTPAYTIFEVLSKTEKWGSYMQDVRSMISPYHNIQDPDRIVAKILGKIGFKNIEIRCKQTLHIFNGVQELKDLTAGISPFRFPREDMYEDFLNDYAKEANSMNLFDAEDNTFKFIYNLIVVHCTK